MKQTCVVVIVLTLLLRASMAPAATAQAKKPAVDDSPQAQLEQAKAAFVKAVGDATKKLNDQYDAVAKKLKASGQPEMAAQILVERDRLLAATTRPAVEGRALVEDGWTILLRSDNPLLWNVEVNNADSYALPIKAAPASMKYLRVRRMDTKEEVIIEATREALTTMKWPSAKPVFRGDKRINRQACVLGIVDAPKPAPDHSAPLMALADGWFSGWGFAEPGEGAPEAQAWVWGGQTLGATVMEIAVTAGPLKDEESENLLR